MTTTVRPVILCHLTKLVQCHWLLSPSCTSYIPITYLFCNCKFVPLDPLHLFHPFQSRLLWQPPTSLLNLWVFTCFVDPTCKWNQAVFVFLVFHLTSYPCLLQSCSQRWHSSKAGQVYQQGYNLTTPLQPMINITIVTEQLSKTL